MQLPEDQLSELRLIYPLVAVAEEGGTPFVLLPQLELPDGATPSPIDALLCPTKRDGYASRLFFAERVRSPRNRNWNASGVVILNRRWYAHSWRVRANLRLAQMVGEHLAAFP